MTRAEVIAAAAALPASERLGLLADLLKLCKVDVEDAAAVAAGPWRPAAGQDWTLAQAAKEFGRSPEWVREYIHRGWFGGEPRLWGHPAISADAPYQRSARGDWMIPAAGIEAMLEALRTGGVQHEAPPPTPLPVLHLAPRRPLDAKPKAGTRCATMMAERSGMRPPTTARRGSG